MHRAPQTCAARRGRRRLSLGLFGLVIWAIGCAISPALAVAEETRGFLRDHLTLEGALVGGWRSSWAEENNPGFHVAGGGGEINFGLELDSGFGVLVGTRALFGQHLGNEDQLSGAYTE